MDEDIEKLVVIGCSCGGKEALEYLVPKIELSSSAVLIVPHIRYEEICESLSSDVITIKENTRFEPGRIYLLGYQYAILDDVFEIPKSNNSHWGDWGIDYIMKMASEAYRERCIGVVLTGFGNDGAKGTVAIKDSGGKVLVQIEEQGILEGDSRYSLHNYVEEMPRAAMEATTVDFSGPLAELIDKLNGYIHS